MKKLKSKKSFLSAGAIIVNRTPLFGALLGVMLCVPGCTIVSEIVIINSTAQGLIVEIYDEAYSGGYEESRSCIIKSSEIKSFNADIYWKTYLNIWAGETLVAKLEFPSEAIATEVKISLDEDGDYIVKGKYIDIGEYDEEESVRPVRKRKHSRSKVPFSD